MASQLRVDKILPVDGAPTNGGGGIIQVQSTTKTDTDSFASDTTNTFVDLSGLSVSITPKFSTSKILVMFTVAAHVNTGTVHIRLMRGSTPIAVADADGNSISSTVSRRSMSSVYNLECTPMSYTFLDSPNTTSATTYKLQGTAGSSYNATFYINRGSNTTDANYNARVTSTITVMEVSA